MALNTKFPWDTNGGDYDVETVYLHENGHALGLGHSQDPPAVMEAHYGGVQKTLFPDDIDGVSALYPGACAATCVNNTIECSEECDGTDLGSETCAGLGFEGGGTLGCDLDCTFNTDLCITCGDGVCEGLEDSCSCPSDCGGSLCGNDTIDCSETCDGGNLGGKSCTTLGLGFDGGDLTCNTNCDGFITSACTSPGCALLQLGETCASDGACCSNKCRGKPGNKTCK